MVAHHDDDVTRAQTILRGQDVPGQELWDLARRLQKAKQLHYARRLMARARRHPDLTIRPDLRLPLAQQHAVCTYKDPDLPADARLEQALEILEEVEDLCTTQNAETLGIAGAICKRKWELDGQRQHLERALFYYYRGYEQGGADSGYPGVNAAFVLDLLAHEAATEAKKAGMNAAGVRPLRARARKIRAALVRTLPDLVKEPGQECLERDWWFLVTVAEAYFGLAQYREALQWLMRAAALPDVPDWERETTARQLAALAHLQEDRPTSTTEWERSPAWETLSSFLGRDVAAVRSAFAGKVGLALSGGGFRASLFHIGVLAKLAELDLLRSVEVLSCVSGGSIIGAHYYLEVRQLLHSKQDSEITRDDYIQIVQRIEKEFLAGVQRNIRMRVAADLRANLKMFWSPNYSTTERAGELFEEEIFARVHDGEERTRSLNELFIRPAGESAEFVPKYHNWRRRAKVPALILNATTLNTGHNWQFTASWMGEPPAAINSEVDGNCRLRRMYYDQAPEQYRKVRLGKAVAASAAVPGIFQPIIMAGLYPGMTVLLADGGVHDNQGVTGLLEQDCTVLLVSDASGQMETQDDPGTGLVGVPFRANTILMARVREAQYEDLAARLRSPLLRGLMFVHLRKDLDVDPVDWVDCQDPHDATDEARPVERRGPLTRYGMPKELQRRLAASRTDLDSFSDVEAYALMTSGYRMTEYEFGRCVMGFPDPEGERPHWRFLAIERLMDWARTSQSARSELTRLLELASRRFFKVLELSTLLRAIVLILAVVLLVGVLAHAWRQPIPLLTVGTIVSSFIAPTVANFILPRTLVRVLWFRRALTEVAMGLAMCLFGWAFCRFYLYVLDPFYLRRGRIDRLLNM